MSDSDSNPAKDSEREPAGETAQWNEPPTQVGENNPVGEVNRSSDGPGTPAPSPAQPPRTAEGETDRTDIQLEAAATADVAPPNASRFFPRFGILTLLLFTGCVCVWSLFIQLSRENPKLVQQIKQLREMSSELVMEDPTRLSIAKQLPSWYDEMIWTVYIPPETSYDLTLTTRELPEFTSDPDETEPVAKTTLKPGTYKVELRQTENEDGSHRVVVLIDDKETLVQEEPEAWDPGRGASGGAQFKTPAQPRSDARYVSLIRRRFMQEYNKNSLRAPKEPTNGVMLRLEKR